MSKMGEISGKRPGDIFKKEIITFSTSLDFWTDPGLMLHLITFTLAVWPLATLAGRRRPLGTLRGRCRGPSKGVALCILSMFFLTERSVGQKKHGSQNAH
jgi:hypothetical protein